MHRCRGKCVPRRARTSVARVLVCAWLHLAHIPNCEWLSHNTRVNEAEPSIGAGSGSQVGNLLVCLSGEDSEPVLILMNSSPVTSACLYHSLQRLVQVTDGTASLCHGNRILTVRFQSKIPGL